MFKEIQAAVLKQAAVLAGMRLLRVTPGDDLFEKYLSCFPEAVVKQEHNCNACKSFIRQYGKIVGVKEGRIHTLWDFEIDGVYSEVPKVLGDIVRNAPIEGVFATEESTLGTPINRAIDKETGVVTTWEHFYWKTPDAAKRPRDRLLGEYLGTQNTNRAMLKRALEELTLESLQTVAELSDTNTLYRGKDYVRSVKDLIALKKTYVTLSDREKELFSWEHLDNQCVRVRNTAIGTLLVDLSEGRDIETAVRAYEQVVAPTNYKRPSALVTKAMVEKARQTIKDLGLERALARRYAKASDITVDKLLFANRDTPVVDLFDEIAGDLVVDTRKLKVDKTVHIDQFIEGILPDAQNIELLLQDRLTPNLMTLVTAVDEDAPALFDWGNNFSWSYAEGLADSIKKKVKAAGGKVDGELRISLEWSNYDDLDLHVVEPHHTHIYYAARRSPLTGGALDVDMNAGEGTTRTPVENVIYTDKDRILPGSYTVYVHNFHRRESTDSGFTVEIECRGQLLTFSFPASPSNNAKTDVATFTYRREDGITLTKGEPTSSSLNSRPAFSLGTNKFHKVDMIMLSPNYWNGQGRGNKHFFFMLDGATADNPPRAIFNEFLKGSLQEHRKVFEVLGSKIQVDETSEQLNGVGFSETLTNDCIVRVDGVVMNVTFGEVNNV